MTLQAPLPPSYAGDPTSSASLWWQPSVPLLQSTQNGQLPETGMLVSDTVASRPLRSPSLYIHVISPMQEGL